VQETKLRGMLTGLTELRLAEPRTTDPTEFGRLGLDDPNSPASSADLLRLLDRTGAPVVAVIVGHRRVRSQANVPEEIYVRRPGENQTWLAEASLQVDADASLWLDRNVMNIAHDRIASVAVGDQTLVFGRQDGKFVLTQPAVHPKLEDYKVEDVARALELLTFQEVKADADAPSAHSAIADAANAGLPNTVSATAEPPNSGLVTAGSPTADAPGTTHAVFMTNDGLAVTVTVFHADKDVWARFAVAGSSDKVKPEAERMNARLAGWSYQIGSWKEKSLVPGIDDLKAEEPAKPALSDAGKK
jgi:hypothetical protein